jgi:acetyl esterase
MDLDPQARQILDQMASLGAPPMHTLPVDQARALSAGLAAMGLPPEPVESVEDLKVPAPDGTVTVRVYRPAPPGELLPALVYLHGSGWMYGDLEMSDSLCRRLARVSGCAVVAPDYRLAPEHPFPAALDDVAAVLRWLSAEAPSLGIDPARLAVGGESSGGNLAAAAALAARDGGGPALAFQLLICPALDRRGGTASYHEFADGYLLTKETLEWLWSQYLDGAATGDEPLASPMRAADLSGLPPAYVVTASHDPLRDEGEAYAERLRAAGVPAETRRAGGQIHGFFTLAGVIPSAVIVIDETAAALARALRAGES